jgi:hypothetical protein
MAAIDEQVVLLRLFFLMACGLAVGSCNSIKSKWPVLKPMPN